MNLSSSSRSSAWFLPLIVLLVVCLDQASKSCMMYFLRSAESLPVIPNIFSLTLVHNTGIAFGFFHGGSKWLLPAIFLGISILVYLTFKMRNEPLLFRLSFGLVLGGAIGNVIDRLTQGAVIDFLDFHVWPVFNLADSFITVGVSILILLILKGKGKRA